MAEILERIGAGERIDHKETNRVRKDGSQVLVSLSESPLRDAAGPRRGRLGDRARRVGAEACREGAARERSGAAGPLRVRRWCGILFGDIRRRHLDANDKFLRMDGLLARRLAGRACAGAPSRRRSSRHADEAASAEARRAGRLRALREAVRPQGWDARLGARRVRASWSRERGALTWRFVLDIDARKRAEDELAQVRGAFRKGLPLEPVAIGIAEMASGRLIDVNDRCAEFFGYARDEMIGRTVFELGLWADPADRERLVAGISAGGSASRMEAAFRRKSGEIRQALVSMEAMTLAG